MSLVVDASVALKWFVAEPGTDEAVALLEGEERLLAPDLVVAELCNAAWRLHQRGEMSAEQLALVAAFAGAPFAERAPLAGLAVRATALARDLAHPVYDCFYLALAEARDASLVTADARLVDRVSGTPYARRVRALAATPGYAGEG